ncbi:glycosyltransferase family 4 protein [Methylomonas sp. MgM2]
MTKRFFYDGLRDKRKIDIFYVEGPGDVVESFNRWNSRDDVLTETSRTFSGQFFDFCHINNLSAYVLSYHTERKQVNDGQFLVENRPKRFTAGGLRYHLSQVLYGLEIIVIALRYRPRIVNVTSGVTYWFVLAPLKLFGVKLVSHLHNCFWPIGYQPTDPFRRALLALDGWYFRCIADVALCVSPEIERQIGKISGRKHCRVYQFRSQFYRRDFENPSPPPPHDQRPFRVVYAGRIEHNKGVFDIFDMAERLRAEDVTFDICGGGSALDELRIESSRRNLEASVHIHGKLCRPDLLKMYQQGHVVIVPTRSDFCEGLPMVCSEAILLGRPVITTRLSNALDVLGDAIAQAQPDEVDSFVENIRRLKSDLGFYNQLCQACGTLREQFLDGSQGLTAVLERVYQSIN